MKGESCLFMYKYIRKLMLFGKYMYVCRYKRRNNEDGHKLLATIVNTD